MQPAFRPDKDCGSCADLRPIGRRLSSGRTLLSGLRRMSLIPRDHWEHHLGDFLAGLAAASNSKQEGRALRIPKLGDCIPVRSGRAALVAAISALGLPESARVGVPLFCCPVVFKAIVAAGCTPRFVDVDPETFCISSEDLSGKRVGLDAVVAVHMFGNLCDMSSLRAAAQARPIIEDCAQALGSKLNGRMAGSFGDVAFFSFRSGKYLSVGEGGAIFSRDANLRDKVLRVITAMPNPNSREEWVHLATTYLKSQLRSKPLYGLAGYPLWSFLGREMNLSARSGITLSRVFPSDLTITRRRLALLDSAIETQRANAEFYTRTLKLDPGMLCAEKPGTSYNRFHFPLTFASAEQRDLMATFLYERRIDTMKYLDDVVAVATEYYGYAGDCPVAERLSKRVLIIPSYYSLKARDVIHIAESVNAGWDEIAGRGQNEGAHPFSVPV